MADKKVRTVEIVSSKYQPSKKELEEDIHVNATFEEAVKAVMRTVDIKYIQRPKTS